MLNFTVNDPKKIVLPSIEAAMKRAMKSLVGWSMLPGLAVFGGFVVTLIAQLLISESSVLLKLVDFKIVHHQVLQRPMTLYSCEPRLGFNVMK